MNRRVNFRVVSLLIIWSFIHLDLQATTFKVGEKLSYSVSYFGIELGTLNFQVSESEKPNALRLTVLFQSTKPFLTGDLHWMFASDYDTVCKRSIYFEGLNIAGDSMVTQYNFNYDLKTLFITRKDKQGRVLKKVSKVIEPISQDALSLFYFARTLPIPIKNYSMETWNDISKVEVIFHSDSLIKRDKNRLVYKIWGKMNGIAFWGFRDEFEGYFSSDHQKVPIMAKLKVFIGSISCELIEDNE